MGTRARSELESEFSERNSITMALAKSTTLATNQSASSSRFGDTHGVCIRRAQILKMAWVIVTDGKPGPMVWNAPNLKSTMQRLLQKTEKPEEEVLRKRRSKFALSRDVFP